MSLVRPRMGIFATVDGQEYEANGRPQGGQLNLVVQGEVNPNEELFTWSEVFSCWLARIPVDRCERLVEVVTNATHDGQLCRVVAISDDGSVGLYYIGEDAADAEGSGFVEIGAGVWAKTVNIFEIRGNSLHECHYDLLFAEWARKKMASVI
jgi:hypothetical protein